MLWIEKWFKIFNGLGELYHRAKFGKIVQRAPAVGAKMWCFFVTLRGRSALPERETEFQQLLYHGLWVDFEAVFTVLTSHCLFRRTR